MKILKNEQLIVISISWTYRTDPISLGECKFEKELFYDGYM